MGAKAGVPLRHHILWIATCSCDEANRLDESVYAREPIFIFSSLPNQSADALTTGQGMASSPFDIKRRVYHIGTPSRASPTGSNKSQYGARSPQRTSSQEATLVLQKVIGASTVGASGLTTHYESNSFAFCAGSVAVLARFREQGALSFRYFRAHPAAMPIQPCVSVYNSTATPPGTPRSHRRTVHSARPATGQRANLGSPRRNGGETASPGTWNLARDRVKAVSCIGLSSDGSLLATGEVGYCPRVNIFFTAERGEADVPVSILSEHTFGVRAVAFSPDSRWLATLGDINDGFLFVWSVNPKTGAARLHLTNKCTASVLDMTWCGNSLITVGIRHVKVWRIEEISSTPNVKQNRYYPEKSVSASPTPKTLPGRNCRLGDLMGSTFTCIKPISASEAILCTSVGDVCLLTDHAGKPDLRLVDQVAFWTPYAGIDPKGERVYVTDSNQHFNSSTFDEVRLRAASRSSDGTDSGHRPSPRRSSSKLFRQPSRTADEASSTTRAMSWQDDKPRSIERAIACLPGRIVTINEAGEILLYGQTLENQSDKVRKDASLAVPSPGKAVQGIIPLPATISWGTCMTWSADGAIKCWSTDGLVLQSVQIELDQAEETDFGGSLNELRVVRMSSSGEHLLAGDRLGVLQIIETRSWSPRKIRAHASEIMDMALDEASPSFLLATAGRDRTLQLFRWHHGNIELVQTLEEHTAAVTAVMLASDYLLSASSDRTIVVRQRAQQAKGDEEASPAYASSKVIMLKASPVSLALLGPEEIIVSTMDKHVTTFNLVTGMSLGSIKTLDTDGEDAVVLSSLHTGSVISSNGSCRILVGFAAIDKSIQVWDLDRGSLLASELGHTEGISGVTLLSHPESPSTDEGPVVISTGLDGLIMVWRFQPRGLNRPSASLSEIASAEDWSQKPIRESILNSPPKRKVLPKVARSDGDKRQPPVSPTKGKNSDYTRSISKQSLTAQREHSPASVSSARVRVGHEPSQMNRCTLRRRQSLSSHGISNSALSTIETPTPLPQAKCDVLDDSDQVSIQRMPGQMRLTSPIPAPATGAAPLGRSVVNTANRGRLRRPPSLPSNLGCCHQERGTPRNSLGHISKICDLDLSSEVMCHSLRAYRKKLATRCSTDENMKLDSVGKELLATLRLIEEHTAQDDISMIKSLQVDGT